MKKCEDGYFLGLVAHRMALEVIFGKMWLK